EDFRTKVRCTVLDLRANRFELRQLIYCSPQEIIKEADELKKALRKDGISLDIRDRGYFATFCNTAQTRVVAAENLAKRKVDPLLTSLEPVSDLPNALTSEEERIALAYLRRSKLPLPTLELKDGYNTRQVLNYAKLCWRRDFTSSLARSRTTPMALCLP